LLKENLKRKEYSHTHLGSSWYFNVWNKNYFNYWYSFYHL